MNRVFAITAAAKEATLALGDNRQGKVAFTVTNTTERTIRGQLNVKPLDSTKSDWLTIVGEKERDFPANATQQVEVGIAIPPDVAAGKYAFRLDAVSVVNPDEDYTEGPNFALEVKAKTEEKKPFPWWIIAVAAVVLIAGSVGAWLLLRHPKVTVPPVTTMEAETAKKAIGDLKLKVKIVTQEKCDAIRAEVSSQEPEAGKVVNQDTEVTLNIDTPVIPIKLDNYVGKKIDEVREIMKPKCIVVGENRIPIAGTPEGTITKQDPPKDTEIKKGGKIAFDIAVPLVPFEMLKVVGENQLIAKNILQDKGLNVTLIPVTDIQDINQQLKVVRQSIPQGTSVTKGQGVTLEYVYITASVPEGLGMKWRDYQNRLSQAGLVLGAVRGDCEATIIKTDPSISTNVPKGAWITVYLSGDTSRNCNPLVFDHRKLEMTNINGRFFRTGILKQ